MRLNKPLFMLLMLVCSAGTAIAQNYYYMPTSAQLPLMQERNDGDLSVGWSRGNVSSGIEIQASFSPVKHVVLTGGWLNIGEKQVGEDFKPGFNLNFYEFGAGLYERLSRGSAALIAGYGFGNVHNYYQGEENAKLTLHRY